MKFENLYKKYYNQIYKYVFKRLSYKFEDAEELTQDIFIKVHRNLKNYDSNKSKISTWIYIIAKSTIIDYYKKKREDIRSLDLMKEINEDFDIPSFYNPLNILEDKELNTHLNFAFEKLKGIQKEIAVNFFMENKSHSEICEKLGIKLWCVKDNILLSRKKLKSYLNQSI